MGYGVTKSEAQSAYALRGEEMVKKILLATKIVKALEPVATGACEQPMALCSMCENESLCSKLVGLYREAQGIANKTKEE